MEGSILHQEYSHTFPAVRGMQAGRPCYIAMCPMRLVPKIFMFDEEEVPAEMRAQRTLNKSRVPEIADYLVSNLQDYTLSAITASVGEQVHFDPMADTGPGQNIGMLSIPMDATILINDGQHRRAAIEEAINESHELGYDHISVLFFVDEDLKRSQQMFADLNKHAVRPNESISTLYDHRDSGSELARYVVKNVELFKRMTDMEKSSLSNRSSKLFTLSSIKQASRALLRKGPKDEISIKEMQLAADYWQAVAGHMVDWTGALNKLVNPSELRQGYIHAHGAALQALGLAGADLMIQHPMDWEDKLVGLRTIPWERDNSDIWEGRSLNHGRLSKARINVVLTANYIREHIGVELTPENQQIEDEYKASKA